MTQAFEIRYPWYRKVKSFTRGMDFERYHAPFITIWHVDPAPRGDDDSCGWFMRSRHGNPAVLQAIIKRFDEDWDRVFESRKQDEVTGQPAGPVEQVFYCGYFYPEDSGAGMPNMGVTAIALNLVFLAAAEHFNSNGRTNWKRPRRFMQKNLFDIMLFAENPTDSLRDSIIRKWGTSSKRDQRIEEMAIMIYGWVLRKTRPWYQHPRWHLHHWKLQIHPWQNLKRRLWDKCALCGKRGFKPGEAISDWNGTRLWHSHCERTVTR